MGYNVNGVLVNKPLSNKAELEKVLKELRENDIADLVATGETVTGDEAMRNYKDDSCWDMIVLENATLFMTGAILEQGLPVKSFETLSFTYQEFSMDFLFSLCQDGKVRRQAYHADGNNLQESTGRPLKGEKNSEPASFILHEVSKRLGFPLFDLEDKKYQFARFQDNFAVDFDVNEVISKANSNKKRKKKTTTRKRRA